MLTIFFFVFSIDEEGDQISIYVEDDMETCIAMGGKVPKVYIDLNVVPTTKAATNVAAATAAVAPTIGLLSACPFVRRSTETAAAGVSTDQSTSSSSPSPSNVVHLNVVCDGCDGEVRGFRYKCVQCRDFDLCQRCEAKGMHKQHVMYRMPEPLNVRLN